MKGNDLYIILLIGFSFGIINVLTKLLATTSSSHPIEIVMFRYLTSIAIAILILMFILNKNIKNTLYSFKTKDLCICIIISTITVITGWCTLNLLKTHSNTTIGPLNSCTGLIFAVILSAIFLNERPSYTKIVGIFVLIIGFFMVVNGDQEMKYYITKNKD